MRTTTCSSRPHGRRRSIELSCALLLLAGCATPAPQPGILEFQPESPASKARQTRHFDTSRDLELLSASAAVLQGLGFQISESVPDLGFLRAAKERGAREYGQEVARVFVALLTTALSVFGGGNVIQVIPVDLHQQVNASLIAAPLDDGTRHQVRISFYRVVWKGSGQSGNVPIPPGAQRMEMIRDAGIYREFFARLSEAVVLEAHEI